MRKCKSPELFRSLLTDSDKGLKINNAEESEILEMLSFARDNEIETLLIEGLKRDKKILNKLSNETVELLDRIKRNAVFKNLVFMRELRNLAERIPRCLAGKLILLKGAALSKTLHYSDYLRRMNDIDLLSQQDSFEDFEKIILSLGYQKIPFDRRRPYTERNFYEVRFIKSAGEADEVIVELHKSLCEGERFDIPMKELFARALPHPEWNGVFSVLSPEDTYIHLCIHLAQKLFDETLKHLYDIFIFLDHDLADFETVIERSKRYGVKTIVQISSSLAIDVFKPQLTDKYHFLRQTDGLADFLRKKYLECYFSPKTMNLYRFEHHLRLRQALVLPFLFDNPFNFAKFALHYVELRILDMLMRL